MYTNITTGNVNSLWGQWIINWNIKTGSIISTQKENFGYALFICACVHSDI